MAEETEPTLPKGRVWAFVRAVPIFVQLHWFRLVQIWLRLVQIGSEWFRLVQNGSDWFSLVQIGSDWLWRELQVFTTDDQGGKWQAEVQLGQEGRQGDSDTMQFLPSIFHSILHGSKGE